MKVQSSTQQTDKLNMRNTLIIKVQLRCIQVDEGETN